MSRDHEISAAPSHSVGFFRERFDNHFLFVISPSLHHRLRVRVHDRVDVVDDIFLLSAFFVQGHTVMRQRCKSSSDIELWSASDADMEMRKAKVNELLDKRKDLFTRR